MPSVLIFAPPTAEVLRLSPDKDPLVESVNDDHQGQTHEKNPGYQVVGDQ